MWFLDNHTNTHRALEKPRHTHKHSPHSYGNGIPRMPHVHANEPPAIESHFACGDTAKNQHAAFRHSCRVATNYVASQCCCYRWLFFCGCVCPGCRVLCHMFNCSGRTSCVCDFALAFRPNCAHVCSHRLAATALADSGMIIYANDHRRIYICVYE